MAAAVSYLPPEPDADSNVPGGDRGLVARVARGADYHPVMRGKLSEVAARLLGRYPNARLKICVDTTPLPERRLSVLAGVGWLGRNCCIYTGEGGSWVALGEIVTDLDLPAPEPLASVDRCGDCRRCIDACPTGAIWDCGEGCRAVFDGSRCLSRLTQASGIIPTRMRRALGNRIYGCDICQEVCPQNAGVRPSTPEFAKAMFPGAHPELIPLITISPDEFGSTVQPSSIGWIRRRRIRRNAVIAAGNLKCMAAVSLLEKTLQDQDANLSAYARWASREILNATPAGTTSRRVVGPLRRGDEKSKF